MTCYSVQSFLLFLADHGFRVAGDYPVYVLMLDDPKIVIWNGLLFCLGGFPV